MRPMGWKRDRDDAVQPWRAHRVGLAQVRDVEESPSQVQWRTQRFFQAPYNACAAFAIGSCLWTSVRMRKPPLVVAEPEPPSFAFIYAVGRAREYAGQVIATRPDLVDGGMYPSLALEAVRDLGYVGERHWPYEPLFIEREPAPQIFRAAIDQSGLSWSRLGEPGVRIEAMRDAFARDATVAFSMIVDRPFEMNDGGVVRSMSEKTVGEHGMRVLALDSARKVVVVENWWDNWGVGGTGNLAGCGFISFDLFEHDVIGNVYAIDSAPPVAPAEDT